MNISVDTIVTDVVKFYCYCHYYGNITTATDVIHCHSVPRSCLRLGLWLGSSNCCQSCRGYDGKPVAFFDKWVWVKKLIQRNSRILALQGQPKKSTRNSDQDCLSWINPQFFWVPNGDASDSSSAWWQHAKHPIGNCKEHCTFRLQRTSKNTESHEELLWFVKLATAKRMISEVIGLILVQKDVSTTLDKIQKRSMRVLYKSQKGYHGFNQIITQF